MDHDIKSAGVGTQGGGGSSSCVRGRRIGPGRLYMDAEGNLYVPDSEDEASDMEVEVPAEETTNRAVDEDLFVDGPPAVATAGPDGENPLTEGPPAVVGDAPAGEHQPAEGDPELAANGATHVDPVVTVDGAAGEKMHPEVAARLAKKVLGEDLHPEVAEHLAIVLSRMETLYHECFISMYKVMVPSFFKPPLN